MNTRLGNIPSREPFAQMLDNHGWPLTVEPFPRGNILDRGAEMIA
jgi:hypothetical protein